MNTGVMQISVQSKGPYATALRAAGFRATYGRVVLLSMLAEVGKPLSVGSLAQKLKGKLDLTNTYRALEALQEAGLVRRVDLGHVHTHYSANLSRKHEHAFICASCGMVKT